MRLFSFKSVLVILYYDGFPPPWSFRIPIKVLSLHPSVTLPDAVTLPVNAWSAINPYKTSRVDVQPFSALSMCLPKPWWPLCSSMPVLCWWDGFFHLNRLLLWWFCWANVEEASSKWTFVSHGLFMRVCQVRANDEFKTRILPHQACDSLEVQAYRASVKFLDIHPDVPNVLKIPPFLDVSSCFALCPWCFSSSWDSPWCLFMFPIFLSF